jgi:hypothetical protein
VSEPRIHHALRARIDQLISQGWSLSGRDPVRLERDGWPVCEVRYGMLIEEGGDG